MLLLLHGREEATSLLAEEGSRSGPRDDDDDDEGLQPPVCIGLTDGWIDQVCVYVRMVGKGRR